MAEKQIYELVSSVDYMNICNLVLGTRKEGEDGAITYQEVEYTLGGTSYKIQGHHFPIQDVVASANKNCKECNSKGYTTISILKSKLPDPSGYFVEEEEEHTLPEGGAFTTAPTDFWKITTPCECAVKNVIKKNPSVFTIDTRCVFISLTHTVDKPTIKIAR